MRKACALFLSFLSPICILAFLTENVRSPSGVDIVLSYRILEPGEVMMVKINSQADIQEAHVLFLGKKFPMGKNITNSVFYAFIGIEMDINPGLYEIKVYLKDEFSRWEKAEKLLLILPKKFRLARLWVDKRFITPPPEFHDRIRWEAQILRGLYDISTPRWLGEGNFIFAASGQTSADFGEKRIYNNTHYSTHRGVDISSPYGAPVVASNSGKVVLASDLYYSGKTVILDHGLGVYTLYCHFSKISVETGTLVNKGQFIGEIGATGRVTGPHLHWGVKMSGESVDPISLLSLDLD